MNTLIYNLIYRPNRWLDAHEPIKFWGMLGYIVVTVTFSVIVFGGKSFSKDICELTLMALMIAWRFTYLRLPNPNKK